MNDNRTLLHQQQQQQSQPPPSCMEAAAALLNSQSSAGNQKQPSHLSAQVSGLFDAMVQPQTNHHQHPHLDDINQLQGLDFMQPIKGVANQNEATSLLFENLQQQTQQQQQQQQQPQHPQRRWNDMVQNQKKHECSVMQEKENMLLKQQQQQQQQHHDLNANNHRNKLNDLNNFMDIQNQLSQAQPQQQQQQQQQPQQQANNTINPLEQFNFNETTQYPGAVALFPPANVQVPFPSPGTAMFPPNYASNFQSGKQQQQPHHPMLPTAAAGGQPQQQQQQQQPQNAPQQPQQSQSVLVGGAKPDEMVAQKNLCGATFTSSSHNIALTEAIVSPPTPHQQKQPLTPQMAAASPLANMVSPANQQQPTPEHNFMMNHSPGMMGPHTPQMQQQRTPQQDSSGILQSLDQNSGSKKSPTKSSRSSSRIQQNQVHEATALAHMKSPANISPGKSPKTLDAKQQQQQSQLSQPPSVVGGKGIGKPEGGAKRGPRGPRTNSQSQRGGAAAKSKNGRQSRGGRQQITFIPQLPHNDYDFMGGTIHNKLIGTVYDPDFDDDLACNSMEKLRDMRDRRRSIDCRMPDSFRASREPSKSPKFPSLNLYSSQNSALGGSKQNRSSFTPTSMQSSLGSGMVPGADISVTQPSVSTRLQDMVQTVLPGPVDMRTYNSGFDSSAANTDAFNNHLLGAFASGTADQTLVDIDEDMENELQSALKASNNKVDKTPAAATVTLSAVSTESSSTTTTLTNSAAAASAAVLTVGSTLLEPVEPPQEETNDSDSIVTKVSLSDSRNIMKLKIKGPLAQLDNSSSSSTATLQQSNVLDPSLTAPNMSTPMIGAGVGSSNLRRMRKKELLRQYWTQDMNHDDQSGLQVVDQIPTLSLTTSISRTVGIPKAVDSLCTIPTKDDYKDYGGVDFKKRKKLSSNMSRELRGLVPTEHEINERRRSVGSTGSNGSNSNLAADISPVVKRRSRTNRTTTVTAVNQPQAAPKLKIKIGSGVVEASGSYSDRIRPPKKRLATAMAPPSLEDLRRDAMMFAEQMMFEDEEEGRKSKKHKNKDKERDREHKKRKKEKKHKKEKGEKVEKVEIINKSDDAPRIVIRLGVKKPSAPDEVMNATIPDPNRSGFNSPEVDPLALDPVEIEHSNDNSNCSSGISKPLITPIRLKLARNSAGGGYVMSSKNKDSDKATHPPTCEETKTLNIVLPKLDIPLNKELMDLSAVAGDKPNSDAATPPPEGLSSFGTRTDTDSPSAGNNRLLELNKSIVDLGAMSSSYSSSTSSTAMSFNCLAGNSSGTTAATGAFSSFGPSSQQEQQSQQSQQEHTELNANGGGKDCEVR